MKTLVPPSDFGLASPQISVQIHPQNGSAIVINQSGTAGILKAEIEKNIRNRDGGRFTIYLTAGGRAGINDPVSWVSLISLNSFTVISLSRGSSKKTVMLGVINEISEDQIWDNEKTIRVVKICGMDFTYFFSAFSYYLLTYIGLIPANFPTGAAGYILGLFNKEFGGPPAEQAFLWLNYVMLGVGSTNAQAALENTFVYYNGQKVFLKQLFSYWFEAFNELGTTLYVPFLTDVVNSEGSWMDKFLANLPWPYYEFFINTATPTDYPAFGVPSTVSSSSVTVSGAKTVINTPIDPNGDIISTASNPFVIPNYGSVSPTIIGRVNPMPWIEYPTLSSFGIGSTFVNSSGAFTVSGSTTLHRDRWDALDTYKLDPFSFIQSGVKYDLSELANFFVVNTVDSSTIAQQNGGDPVTFAFELLGGVLNPNAINTYGFVPASVNIRWLTTTSSAPIPSGEVYDFNKICTVLLGKFASYNIPGPNMLNGIVTIPMWPTIFPGNKFAYKPFKNSTDEYLFYIEGVTHQYNYGEDCITTLCLSRGLKSSEYADSSILSGVLLDTHNRVEGNLVPRKDLKIDPSAYYISQATLSTVTGSAHMPSNQINPNVTVNGPYPSGTTTAFDATFIAAAAGTTCGTTPGKITPELLKGIAYRESGINNSATNPTTGAIGIMQVLPGQGYDDARLRSDPVYNINVGAQILCNKLSASGGNIDQALIKYVGASPGNPAGPAYVRDVKNYANSNAKLG